VSSENSYPRCALEIRPSLCLKALVVTVTALAVAAPWLAGMPFLLAIPVSLCAIPAELSLWGWANGNLARIVWQPVGRWQLLERNGQSHDDARLLPGILVGSRLVALRWRCEECGLRFRTALLMDNCDADAFRRLRVRLRMTGDDELFKLKAES
jgi:hypothetical protein